MTTKKETADARRYRLAQEARQKRAREDQALFQWLHDELTKLEKAREDEKKK